jgi:cellulose synthase/poly-beta-1,6-N-acetylglucosamine synthase-like glycosyltransferase
MILYTFVLLVLGLYAVQIFVYTLILLFDRRKISENNIVSKKTAILVACRNEEKNILACLQSLHAQDYPMTHLEIWIGDDDSSDNTAQIIQDFIHDKPHFHYVKITQKLAHLKAKQNVLAQLAHKTNAEILLITDADIITPKTWVKTMVSAFDNEKTGIVCGTTYILPKGFFSTLQSIDWLFYMGIAKSNMNIGFPITAVGNNMAIRTDAYKKIGGYESIAFSITEDYKLFKEILKQTKYNAKWIYCSQNTNITYSTSSLLEWLHQRKRWLKGGLELPLSVWILMLFNVCVELSLYASMAVNMSFFLSVLFAKTIVNSIFLCVIFAKLNLWKKAWIWSIGLYALYQMWLIPVLFIYFLLPFKVKWKERTY